MEVTRQRLCDFHRRTWENLNHCRPRHRGRRANSPAPRSGRSAKGAHRSKEGEVPTGTPKHPVLRSIDRNLSEAKREIRRLELARAA